MKTEVFWNGWAAAWHHMSTARLQNEGKSGRCENWDLFLSHPPVFSVMNSLATFRVGRELASGYLDQAIVLIKCSFLACRSRSGSQESSIRRRERERETKGDQEITYPLLLDWLCFLTSGQSIILKEVELNHGRIPEKMTENVYRSLLLLTKIKHQKSLNIHKWKTHGFGTKLCFCLV